MAKGKITLQMLSEMMANNSGRSKSATELFVRNFFSILKEALMRDNIIKIKGFGTFKMVVVNARESVNVNTGERVSIAEYNKITFTPDKSLKERINRPFAHFDTIVVDDEDIEIINGKAPVWDIEPETPAIAEPAVVSEMPAEPLQTPVPVEMEEKREEVVDVADVVEVEQPDSPDSEVEDVPEVAEAESELTAEDIDAPQEPVETKEVRERRRGRWTWVWIFLIVVLAGVVVFMFMRMREMDALLQQGSEACEVVEKDTLATVSSVPEDQDAKLAHEAELDSIRKLHEAIAEYPQIEGGKYYVTGIRTYRKVKSGYNVRRYCLQIYGKTDAEEYVLLINNLKSSDVPNGKILKFPLLVEK